MKNALKVFEYKDYSMMVERAARRALWAEVSLFPKPGLVSPVDNGSHSDMTMTTLLRSIHALRYVFGDLAELGARGATYGELQRLSIEAEARMLTATKGINTHRGGLFTLGLLSAAAGYLSDSITAQELSKTVISQWGADIAASAPETPISNGAIAVKTFRVNGARQEAASGFPTLMNFVLPSLIEAECNGADREQAMVQALFTAMAQLDDTNVLHRGGEMGLSYAKVSSKQFLDNGGVFAPDWRKQAIAIHRDFVLRNLSPGGAADMLAAAVFVRELI